MSDLALSPNEREALSRFVSKMIDDVDHLSSLFESRDKDTSDLRSAHASLQRTLDSLRPVERLEIKLQARVAEGA